MAVTISSGLEISVTLNAQKAEKAVDKLGKAIKDAGDKSDTATKRLQQLGNAANYLAGKTFNAVKNLTFAGLKIHSISELLSRSVKEANSYIENLNLFNVAMGEYADSAKEYANEVSTLLGIDPSEWMRRQGVYMTLGTGFGVAADKAALMSKNLTQLAYDISSFYNINVDDAAQRLESAFAGELEPVRRLGYDLSQTRLQQVAYAHGINTMIQNMTQAEKSQLRYIALIEQVSQVHGDMARTINSPANQIRVLQAQVTQLVRAIGNLFIPILNAVLPYIIAVTKALRNMAQTIASFFGYTLPEVDYSTVVENNSAIADTIDDTADAYSGATKAAKAYKNTILGIDEIHKLNDTSESSSPRGGGGGGASVTGGGDSFAFDLPQYDFLAGFAGQLNDVSGALDGIFSIVGAIGTGLLTWKIANSVTDFFNKFFNKGIPSTIPIGIGLFFAGLTGSFMSGFDMGRNGMNFVNVLTNILSTLAAGVGGKLLFGSLLGGPLGFAIGITAGLALTIAGMYFGHQQHIRDIWEASEFYKDLQENKEQLKAVLTVDTEINLAIDEAYNPLQAIEDQYGEATKLVNELYDAMEKGSSPTHIQAIVDALNALNLGDLRWEYGETTNSVNRTKEASKKLVDQWYKEAKAAAMKEILTDLLKEEYRAEMNLRDARESQSEAMRILDDQQRQINENVEKHNRLGAENEAIVKRLGLAGAEQNEVFVKNNEEMRRLQEETKALKLGTKELTDNVFAQSLAVTQATITQNKANTAVEQAKKDLDSMSGSATKATTATQNVGNAAKTTGDYVEDLGKDGKNAIQQIRDTAQKAGIDINSLKNYFGDFGTNAQQSVLKIRGAFVDLTEAMKTAKRNFPEMTSQVRVGTTEYYLRMNGYATGGYPRQGELFLARESGPELVGSIGGQTAVANNQDIVAGISQGVYNAMRAAGGNGGTTVVQVVKDGYIESEQIINSADRRNRRDGKTVISVGS